MGWFALLIAMGSLGVSGFTFKKNKSLTLALEAEKRESNSLKETLVDVLDMEGNIRGQLALPGQVTNQGVANRLALAEKSVSTIQDEIKKQTEALKGEVTQASADLREASGALEAAQSREEELTKTLANIVDGDGEVLAQLRLPGEQVKPPIKTPCGDMCKLATRTKIYNHYGNWEGKMSDWCCVAGQGRPCDKVRKQFVDAQGQCVLFVRDDDC
jgi:hypothetical protein